MKSLTEWVAQSFSCMGESPGRADWIQKMLDNRFEITRCNFGNFGSSVSGFLALEGPRNLAQGEVRNERHPGISGVKNKSPRRGRRKASGLITSLVSSATRFAGLDCTESGAYPGFRSYLASPWAKFRSSSGARNFQVSGVSNSTGVLHRRNPAAPQHWKTSIDFKEATE